MDIHSLSDLLYVLAKQENEVLKSYGIQHRPTIGNQYEGLTAEILNKSIFCDLHLTVARNSFIEGSNTEYDIILADGTGMAVKYSERQFVFKPKQVLAVIQVKKNLYGAEVKDSYENLATIAPLYYGKPTEEYVCKWATTSVRNSLGKHVSAYKKGELNIDEEYLYHTLVTEPQIPVRIVLGYNGYSSETNFRKGIVEYLETCKTTANERKNGYGPNDIPNLIVCEGFSCVKITGSPFCPLYNPSNNGWWNLLGTSSYNPMYFLLETIWTKLSYKYQLPSILFGEDLKTPCLSPFLDAKIHKDKGTPIGWDYGYKVMTTQELSQNNIIEEWKPVEIDKVQWVILGELGEKGSVCIKDNKELECFVIQEGYSDLNDFIDKLLATRLVTIDSDNLRLLTYKCDRVCVKGKWYAAENVTGRLTNWAMTQIQE
ncbi:MAG: DUF6602 domain-containing protein [Alloprevotella sp.]|nr:DUF6602 domain-containing protein [Alloprevotella sp.]